MTVDQVSTLWCPYLTMAEGLKIAAQSFRTDLQLVLGQLAAGGGGRAHPRGVPTDDDQPLGHDFPFRYSAC